MHQRIRSFSDFGPLTASSNSIVQVPSASRCSVWHQLYSPSHSFARELSAFMSYP